MTDKIETVSEKECWIKLAKCKVCGRPPLIIPVSKNVTVIGCSHGAEVDHLNGFGRPEDWNNAQK